MCLFGPLSRWGHVSQLILIAYAGVSAWFLRIVAGIAAGAERGLEDANYSAGATLLTWRVLTSVCLAPFISGVALIFLLLSFLAKPDQARKYVRRLFFFYFSRLRSCL